MRFDFVFVPGPDAFAARVRTPHASVMLPFPATTAGAHG
jgi:hypothetical protein